MVEAASEGADFFAPAIGDEGEFRFAFDGGLEDEFAFRVDDADGIAIRGAVDFDGSVVVGDLGGFLFDVDDAQVAVFLAVYGVVEHFFDDGRAVIFAGAEGEFEIEVFAFAEEGDGDFVAGVGEAEEGGELAFVDEELFVHFPDEVELVDSGFVGGAVFFDIAYDEADAWWEAGEVGGGG